MSLTETYNTPLEIKTWRHQQREQLIESRIAVGGFQRKIWQQEILLKLHDVLKDMELGIIAFYWPFKGEIDCRELISDMLQQGWLAALPAVTKLNSPLEFRQWTPETALIPGVWEIPVPQSRTIVMPDLMLIPLLGFDGYQYRRGYGGGYYDRTVIDLQPSPIKIGMGLNKPD
ncbi:MAG: 5-formyltetrahydrofolate cyclo-ligase [Pseudomonadota bacterium]|nr:5-formyltetrahydrofolate cyclo-ligase [Pseudomonadota bacterium]